MARQQVGAIVSLWRYPVKSMLGEELTATEITPRGLAGDRAYALLDTESGKVASAKNPKKWADLLNFQAAFAATPKGDEPLPPVKIGLPDGTATHSDAPEVSEVLSGAIRRTVQLLSNVPATPTLEQYWPPVEGTAYQDTVTQLQMPEGTFFDSCPIHAITTATLNRLQELYPEGQFDPCRFRPNLIIKPAIAENTFIENDWVGGLLTIGDTVQLNVDTHCPRCVVTTLAQSGLPQDINILKTAARHNDVIAGIRLSVKQGGTIRLNDPVWLEK
jgi:hypothetical protein